MTKLSKRLYTLYALELIPLYMMDPWELVTFCKYFSRFTAYDTIYFSSN